MTIVQDYNKFMRTLSLRAVMNSTILCLETGEELGRLKEVVTTTRGDKIVSFLVKQNGGILSPARALSPVDIIEYADQAVIVQLASCVVGLEDIAELTELTKLGCMPIGARVKNVNDTSLGRVHDAWFFPGGHIAHYEVIRHQELRQIDVSSVIKLVHHTLIINDDQRVHIQGAAQVVPLK